MKTPPMWRRYLRFWGPDIEADVEEELRFHLEMRTEELIRGGMDPGAARAEALRRFGDVEQVRRACRKEGHRTEKTRRRREVFSSIGQDIRYATRQLRKSPGFTAVAVLTLAFGIGANTAIFSVVSGVLLRPLPYEEPEQLVRVWPEQVHPEGMLTVFRERGRTLQGVAAYTGTEGVTLTGGTEPERLLRVAASEEFFRVLGVAPALGRTFRVGEGEPGAAAVAVLSYGLWQRRFGSDPEIIGRTIVLDGTSHTVIGVMPPNFHFPSRRADLWTPLQMNPADAIDTWGVWHLSLIGRLGSNATAEEAAMEIGALAPQTKELYPWPMADDYGSNASAVPLHESTVSEVRPTLLLLFGTVGFVLLIACANVANLLLARASTREREVAIRNALGAGRERIIRQLLTESVLLAFIGGALGLLLAVWSVTLLVAHLPSEVPRVAEIGIDGRVLVFTAGIALLTGLIFGLFPALRASRPVHGALKEGGRSGSAARSRLADALVAGEIAVAVVLVIGAGLLIRSLWELQQVDPGFRTENVVSAEIPLPEWRYETDAAQRVFYDELLDRLKALPGVRSAAASSLIPLGGSQAAMAVEIDGQPLPPGAPYPIAGQRIVTSGYIRTLGIPLRAGRTFTEADGPDAPGVVLVNRTLAERFWPGGEAVGKRIRPNGAEDWWWTVVGVVGDVKFENLASTTEPEIYVPFVQSPASEMTLVVRTTGELQALVHSLRTVVRALDPDVPVTDIRTMEQVVATSTAEPRFTTVLLGTFAAVALLLAAIGIFGVMSYAVSRRTRELGVRMALGARRSDVLRLVMQRAMVLVGIGVVVGLGVAWGVTRVMATLLYEVSVTDPATFLAVPLLLAATTLLAAYLPARRATRVNPMIALRAE